VDGVMGWSARAHAQKRTFSVKNGSVESLKWSYPDLVDRSRHTELRYDQILW